MKIRRWNQGGQLFGSETLSNKTLTAPVITGVTDGTEADPGVVGEVQEETRVRSSGIGLTYSNQVYNVTEDPLVLEAGDWELSGTVGFNISASTSYTAVRAGISRDDVSGSAALSGTDTIAVADATGEVRAQFVTSGNIPNGTLSVPISPYRVTISSQKTFFLVANAEFTVSTVAAFGTIRARRLR